MLKFKTDEAIHGSAIVGPTGAIWVSDFADSIDEVNVGLVASNYIQASVTLVKEIFGDDSVSRMESTENLTQIELESEIGTGLFSMTQVRGSFIMVICGDKSELNNVNSKINDTLVEIEHIII